MTIRAVYEKGLLRPIEKIDLPESCEVEVEIRQVNGEHAAAQAPMTPGLAKIYELMSERYDSGISDIAERHNEHQP